MAEPITQINVIPFGDSWEFITLKKKEPFVLFMKIVRHAHIKILMIKYNVLYNRGGSRDSVDGGLSYRAIFSIIDGTNCSPKVVLACRSVNLVFISFSVQ